MTTLNKLLIAAMLAASATALQAQFSKPRRAYVEHLVKTNHTDRLYKTGERAFIVVEAYEGGVPLNNTKLYYRTGDEMFLPATDDSVTFHNGKATIQLGTRRQAGFRACSLHFRAGGKDYKDLVKVGFAPETLQPATPVPADFDAFWKATMERTGATAPEAEVTPMPQHSTDKVDVALVKISVGKDGRHMYGYLTRPKDGRRHPVLFCPPGAGSAKITPTTYYSEQGYIYLNVCIHNGCNPELDDSAYAEARKVADNYNRSGIGDKSTFYYREVYAGCARCVDFMCSLPEWDGKNVGVTGGSQGGALAITTAALNPKVTFCATFYPALCDLLGFRNGRAGGWPKYFQKGSEPAGAEQTLPYYDVANFARRLKCPVFFSFGYADDTCSPTSTYAAYNVIAAPKRLAVTPTSGHWRFTATNDEAMEWMRSQWH